MVEIYALLHPVTKEIRYIGKANDSKARLKSHISDSIRKKTPICCWIKKLLSNGLTPLVLVLKTVTENDWRSAEIETISEYRNKGANLLNLANGGDQPYCSKKVRSDNGRKVANSIHSNPELKTLWSLKHKLGLSLKWLDRNGRKEKADEIRVKLKTKGILFNG